ncbi:MAG: hypothetical protein OXC62_17020 [Aestuariivita sp.]|nr:hypothetical protein [Aestuariivita sp.]
MIKRTLTIIFALATFAMLTSCGGGSGGHGDVVRPPAELPPANSDFTDTYPVFHHGVTLHVGTQASPGTDGLINTDVRKDIHLYKGTRADGTSEGDVLAMFEQITPSPHDDAIFPITFRTGPTVRVVQGADAAFLKAVQDAVAIINSVLPWEQQMTFNATPVASPASLDAIPVEHIYVEYSEPSQWRRIYPDITPSHGVAWRLLRHADVTEPDNYALAGWVGLNSTSTMIYSDPNVVRHNLVHELLHNLGFWGHTDENTDRFSDSILTSNANYGGARTGRTYVLSAQDKDLIHASLTRVKPGITPASAITDLGVWSHMSSHQMGVFATGPSEVTFGVWERNGLVQPWAQGPAPTGILDATAHWNGLFLGYIPTGLGVVGDVRLVVQLADLTSGNLTFYDLEQDGGNVWGDGDLVYAVTIDTGRFDNQGLAGKDTGAVTGAFLGLNHEVMAGVLRRPDLVGAFGGKQ